MSEENLDNLLRETMKALEDYNKSPEDVLTVMTQSGRQDWCDGTDQQTTATWTEFAELAKDVYYDGGFGLSQIAEDLTILFRDNTWLSRWEYDGSEGWQYNCPPTIPTEAQPMKQDDLRSEWGIEKELERKTFLAGGTMELDWESTRGYLSWMFPVNGTDTWWIEWGAEKQAAKIDDVSLRGPQLVREL